MKKMKLLGFVACSVIAVVGLTGCGKKNINLNEYTELKITGVDTRGQAELDFDYDKLEDDIARMLEAEVKDSEDAEWEIFEAFANAEECFDFEVNPVSGLSNGDTVVVKAKIKEKVADELGFKFQFKEMKQKVEGLEKARVISQKELFKDVIVEYVGASPDLKVQIRNTSSDDYISGVTFTVDKANHLKIGDKITVEAHGNKHDDTVILEKSKKTYTVEKADKYITSFDQLSKEAVGKIMKEATDLIEAKLKTANVSAYLYEGSESITSLNNIEHVENVELTTSYFVSLKDGLEPEFGWGSVSSDRNTLYITYFADIKLQESLWIDKNDYNDICFAIVCSDLVVTKDGELQYNFDDMEITSAFTKKDSFYENYIQLRKDRSVVTEVDLTTF